MRRQPYYLPCCLSCVKSICAVGGARVNEDDVEQCRASHSVRVRTQLQIRTASHDAGIQRYPQRSASASVHQDWRRTPAHHFATLLLTISACLDALHHHELLRVSSTHVRRRLRRILPRLQRVSERRCRHLRTRSIIAGWRISRLAHNLQ